MVKKLEPSESYTGSAMKSEHGVKYRADHVGSLLRPKELQDAYKDPGVTPEHRTELANTHILRVLARQRDIGLKIFTDGEFRRRGFMSGFHESVEGLDMD